ncbi:metal-dependent hydrolase [Polymorphobacter arshaanensis]|uniref:metal-dependent hydrolase n=1 Tax=Glacieibacterium arshaanense TaxID=2511025 RepID=UPI00140B7152|nr:metal-dependent hydrolase [Polymorphobacter arshaanensis]
MTDLKLRKIPFEFSGVKFIWNPENPGFSFFMNQVSFWAIGLERYFCRAVADAERLITDPAALAEARGFRIQEAQHSLRHTHHVRALIERHPGLQQALDATIDCYDDIYDRHDLKFHLGYAAALEATFTPVFRTIIEHRDVLFGNGDPRVSSLFLWHFCEEIEHRSSALIIFNALYGDSFYRMRMFRHVRRHVMQNFETMAALFTAHVDEGPAVRPVRNPLAAVPLRDRLKLQAGLLASQMPWHNPEHERLPVWADSWFDSYERGEDMTRFYRGPDPAGQALPTNA